MAGEEAEGVAAVEAPAVVAAMRGVVAVVVALARGCIRT